MFMGTRERRERERQERRREILDAARDLFSQKGFSNTRIEDIAEAVELSPGALYKYFRSKDEIYATLAIEAIVLLDRLQGEREKKAQGSVEKAKGFGRGYVEFYREYNGFFDILSYLDHDSQFKNLSEDIRKELASRSLSSLRRLRDLIKDAFEQGEITEADPTETAVILWALLEGMIYIHRRGYLDELGIDLEYIVERSMEIMSRAFEP
jgi:AcrR family transcriptional regulator